MRTTRLLAFGVRDLGLLLLLARAAPASCAAARPGRLSRSAISANSGFWMTRRFFLRLPRSRRRRLPRRRPGGRPRAAGAAPRARRARRARPRPPRARLRPSSGRCGPAPSARTAARPVSSHSRCAVWSAAAAASPARRPAPRDARRQAACARLEPSAPPRAAAEASAHLDGAGLPAHAPGLLNRQVGGGSGGGGERSAESQTVRRAVRRS